MLLPGFHLSRICFFLTVFVATMVVNASPSPESQDKTFNLKIGFDLTHGKDGAPALRIRDFEESNENEYHPRAEEKEPEKKNKEAPLRKGGSGSGSSSSSSESAPDRKDAKKEESSSGSDSKEKGKAKVPPARQGKDMGKDKSGSNESGVSEEENLRSTRGVENFEPEDNRRRRRKRSPEDIARNRRETEKFIDYYFEKMKLKHKKVNKMPDEPRITSYKPY
ncbi:hypothetical protein NE865_14656 [Phthorimaea operculella]|nr:hypothetical protein NE865_14656 [Phthorimaea operculella]